MAAIWTANARVVDGEKLATVGFGGYDLGARQRQIRDDLLAIDKASEPDMLRIQLDDRALFLARWQKLLLELLTPERWSRDPAPAEARGSSTPGAAARPSTRSATGSCARSAAACAGRASPLLAACRRPTRLRLPGPRANQGVRQWEGPLWALVSERPAHLLDPRFASWEALLSPRSTPSSPS